MKHQTLQIGLHHTAATGLQCHQLYSFRKSFMPRIMTTKPGRGLRARQEH